MDQFNNNTEVSNQQPPASHRVNKRAVASAIVLFTLIVVGMFVFAFLKKTELQEELISDAQEQPAAEVKYASITRVDAKHYFIDGVHTLAGEIQMPTPCDLLEVNTTVMESYPEQVEVNFTVLNTADFCEQLVTPQRFKTTVPASADATFSANLMGNPVALNLIPAAEGELPEDFELFIKG